jgi:hypothetical protein
MPADAGTCIGALDLDEIGSIDGAPVDLVIGDASLVVLSQGETRRADDEDKGGKPETQTALDCHALCDSVLLFPSLRQLG